MHGRETYGAAPSDIVLGFGLWGKLRPPATAGGPTHAWRAPLFLRQPGMTTQLVEITVVVFELLSFLSYYVFQFFCMYALKLIY